MHANQHHSCPTLPRGSSACRATLSGASASAPDTFLCHFETRSRAAQKGRIRRVLKDVLMCGCIAVTCIGFLLIGWGLS